MRSVISDEWYLLALHSALLITWTYVSWSVFGCWLFQLRVPQPEIKHVVPGDTSLEGRGTVPMQLFG